MNNILLILGMIALSNGNISLFDNKNKSNKRSNISTEATSTSRSQNSRKKKRNKVTKNGSIENSSRNKKTIEKSLEDIFKFNMGDVSKGLKLMELSDEDLDRGMEIITRTKKYMSKDEKKILIKIESLLDLVKGIKRLSTIEMSDELEESNFFRSMDEEDKKNMMIREIIEVFPEKRKESVEKAIDMKKKIDLFAELFLPDDFGEGGFSLSSLADINNLGSISNLKILGNLLRGDGNNLSYDNVEDEEDFDEEYGYIEDEDEEDYSEFDKYEKIDEVYPKI